MTGPSVLGEERKGRRKNLTIQRVLHNLSVAQVKKEIVIPSATITRWRYTVHIYIENLRPSPGLPHHMNEADATEPVAPQTKLYLYLYP